MEVIALMGCLRVTNAFTIVNDKLYLNYSLDIKAEWLKQCDERILKANENWEKIKNI
jgi:hypothetical protein